MIWQELSDYFIIKAIINTYKTREANKVGSFDNCEAFSCQVCKCICKTNGCFGGEILPIKAFSYLIGGR